jgi:hypothetical protein
MFGNTALDPEPGQVFSERALRCLEQSYASTTLRPGSVLLSSGERSAPAQRSIDPAGEVRDSAAPTWLLPTAPP